LESRTKSLEKENETIDWEAFQQEASSLI
jgi:hypothetical protein